MTTQFLRKDGCRLKVNAQVAGERLEQIRSRNNGKLKAEMVVDDARDKESPLHEVFEWDDTHAAELWRREEARHLIRSVEVVVEKSPSNKPTRAFVHVERGESQSYYTSIVEVMSDTDLRAEVLARALKELDDWHQRYNELDELAGVFAAAEDVKLVNA